MWDKDVPHAWHGSPILGMVTLPEALCPGARPDHSRLSPRPEVPHGEAPWGGTVAPCGEGAPRRRRAATDSD